MWKGPINDRGEENHLKGCKKKKKKKPRLTHAILQRMWFKEADDCRVIEEKATEIWVYLSKTLNGFVFLCPLQWINTPSEKSGFPFSAHNKPKHIYTPTRATSLSNSMCACVCLFFIVFKHCFCGTVTD